MAECDSVSGLLLISEIIHLFEVKLVLFAIRYPVGNHGLIKAIISRASENYRTKTRE